MLLEMSDSQTHQFDEKSVEYDVQSVESEKKKVFLPQDDCNVVNYPPATSTADKATNSSINIRREERRLALNRASAKQRRDRKRDLLSQMEDQVAKLKADNERLVQSNNETRLQIANVKYQLMQPAAPVLPPPPPYPIPGGLMHHPPHPPPHSRSHQDLHQQQMHTRTQPRQAQNVAEKEKSVSPSISFVSHNEQSISAQSPATIGDSNIEHSQSSIGRVRGEATTFAASTGKSRGDYSTSESQQPPLRPLATHPHASRRDHYANSLFDWHRRELRQDHDADNNFAAAAIGVDQMHVHQSGKESASESGESLDKSSHSVGKGTTYSSRGRGRWGSSFR